MSNHKQPINLNNEEIAEVVSNWVSREYPDHEFVKEDGEMIRASLVENWETVEKEARTIAAKIVAQISPDWKRECTAQMEAEFHALDRKADGLQILILIVERLWNLD